MTRLLDKIFSPWRAMASYASQSAARCGREGEKFLFAAARGWMKIGALQKQESK
jgi:hypothetical protein